MTDRTLVLLRHAKAEPLGAAADAGRPLTARGRADAAAAGDWLRAQGLVPDLVLCSPARRTRETWHAVAAALAERAPATNVIYDPELYGASPDQVLELICGIDADVATLLLIGHNPTMSTLSVLLDPAGASAAGLRTCGVAVHRPSGAWSECESGQARLVAAHTARG
jgi:phosphohistidine phosphatase